MTIRCVSTNSVSSATRSPSPRSPLGRASALALLALVLLAPRAEAQTSCFPTCEETDGRFLVVSGGDPTTTGDTFANFEVNIKLTPANPGQPLSLEIFDGDISGTTGFWDQRTHGTEFNTYSLFSDDDQDGVADAFLLSIDSTVMPDNAWFAFPAPATTHPSYVLLVSNPTDHTFSWNGFKLAVNGIFELAPESFAFIGSINNESDAAVIYPNWPGLGNSTYDGIWEFHFRVPAAQTTLTIWDGDLDFGNWNCSTRDTDDPDTIGLPSFDPGAGAKPEGDASTDLVDCQSRPKGHPQFDPANTPSGNPPDDSQSPIYRREPDVRYVLIDPNGVQYANLNPSGNREWEAFTISSDPSVPADYHVGAPLPAGTYTVRMTGMDLGNLNYWHFPFPLVPSPQCPLCPSKQDEKQNPALKGAKLQSLTLQYTGEDCSASNNAQPKAECSGNPNFASPVRIVVSEESSPDKALNGKADKKMFDGMVALNGTFVAQSSKKDKFPANSYVFIFSQSGQLLQQLKVHTSCSQPLRIGDQFGAILIGGGTLGDKKGNPLVVNCAPGQQCLPCEGKVSELTLRYTGATGAQVTITGKKGGPALFSGFVSANGTFDVTPAPGEDTLGTEIVVFIDGVEHTKIHTSCSQPIGPGLVFGLFEVVAGRSFKGGDLCPLTPPPGGENFCETVGKPGAIVLEYTGGTCASSTTSQPLGKYSCTPSSEPLPGTVLLRAAGKKGSTPDQVVSLGEDATIGSQGSNTSIDIYNQTGTQLLQRVQIHTSCSAPLVIGDSFGGLTLRELLP